MHLDDNPLGTVISVLRRLSALRTCRLEGNPLSDVELKQLPSEPPQVKFSVAQP